jgi:hypothetical protein
LCSDAQVSWRAAALKSIELVIYSANYVLAEDTILARR